MARIERMFIVEDAGDSTVSAAGQVDDSVTLVVDEQAQSSSSGSLYDFSLTKTGLLNGIHRLTVIHRNIKDYPAPTGNVSIINGTVGPCKFVDIVPNDNEAPVEPCDPCSCSCGSGADAGGVPTSASRSGSVPAGAFTTSSGGSGVTREATHRYMRWACNFGAFRGMGGVPGGRLELLAFSWDDSLLTPTALSYRHPLSSYAAFPATGVATGQLISIWDGNSHLNFMVSADGAYAFTVGSSMSETSRLDFTSTLSRAEASAVNLSSATYIRLKQADGTAIFYNITTGEFVAYITNPDVVFTAEEAQNYLSIVRDDAGTIRQIWNYWDGLADIVEQASGGYIVSLYTASQVSGLNEETGLYTTTGDPFKQFIVSGNATNKNLIISERDTALASPVDDYQTSWLYDYEVWTIVRGARSDGMAEVRVRAALENGAYRITTSLVKGGVIASTYSEVYRSTLQGDILLSRTDGYGSSAAQTTAYLADAAGRPTQTTQPDGGDYHTLHDVYGREIFRSSPWAGGLCRTVETAYENAEAAYINDPSEVKHHVIDANGGGHWVKTDAYSYGTADGVKRVECRSTACAESATRLTVTETYTAEADNIYARGRLRMTQAENGVQTWYDYAATALHDALYTETVETRLNGVAVAGHSTRTVNYIDAAGNTLRTEEFVMLSNGQWAKIDGITYTYDVQNRLVGTLKDNGRSTNRVLTCMGQVLRETDEDGILTTYSYDSARQPVESTRAAVMDGDTTITPETITEYVRDAAGRVTNTRIYTGALMTENSVTYDALGRIATQTDELGRVTHYAYSADGLTTTITTPTGATLITTSHADGQPLHEYGTGRPERYYTYDVHNNRLRTTVKLGDNSTGIGQSLETAGVMF